MGMFEAKYGAGRFESCVVPVLDDKEALTKVLDGVSGVVHVIPGTTPPSLEANIASLGM
ncbi:hypothetical protein LTR49_014064 [Elasticomyces elasticus]|nr:hypothetical protein LTR49_014064 [Elasticomyces elasticus]KAK5757754.1 hypothetical protein LTS12_012213 [Elasticomyces elasticus]